MVINLNVNYVGSSDMWYCNVITGLIKTFKVQGVTRKVQGATLKVKGVTLKAMEITRLFRAEEEVLAVVKVAHRCLL